jgi:hypothetical protein
LGSSINPSTSFSGNPASSISDIPLFLHPELIGEAFNEQHAENVFLVFGGVHLPAQDIGRFEKVCFKLGEGELWQFLDSFSE